MPELPEVEVTRLGVAPHLEGRAVRAVVLRRSGLRWPFPADLPTSLPGRTVGLTGRRGKYLLIHFEHGTLIVHLGMSGHCACCRWAWNRKSTTISTSSSMVRRVPTSKCCA